MINTGLGPLSGPFSRLHLSSLYTSLLDSGCIPDKYLGYSNRREALLSETDKKAFILNEYLTWATFKINKIKYLKTYV